MVIGPSESNSVCNRNRTTAKRESDLFITNMISDRIGRQTQCVHCPISAQIGQVITNHVREFCYSFDYTMYL